MPNPSPEDVLARVYEHPGAVWLEDGGPGWSILAFSPVELAVGASDWADVGRRLVRKRAAPGPFSGGCIGYLGYGAGHRVERVPAQSATPEPESWLARYEGALCYRRADGAWSIEGTSSFRRKAQRLLERAAVLPPPCAAHPPQSVRSMAQEVWEARVARILELVAAGDCYQVNLTRAVHLEGIGDGWSAWRRLRHMAPSRHGGWLTITPGLAILSSSPELLLEADGHAVASVPIKGTRPRHADPVVDRALAGELRQSEKERAELTMIVDLVRNDLGRVAQAGTVRWDERRITPHPNVHHAEQRVTAELRPDEDVFSALAAVFPPGSVTGAPKVRATERIAELEDEPRGVYCGAMGFVADNGRASFNVAIRTAVWSATGGGTMRYHVGAGIVADSDPTAEWWETVHKGSAMARAFAGTAHPEIASPEAFSAAEPRRTALGRRSSW